MANRAVVSWLRKRTFSFVLYGLIGAGADRRASVEFKTVNPQVIEQFRGGGEIVAAPGVGRENHILLTTVGRKSGRERTTPVKVFLKQDDRVIVVAGNGGRASNPAWYLNLVAEPRVRIEDAQGSYVAVATVLSGDERDDLWGVIQEQNPGLVGYLAGAGREIPIVAFTGEGASK
ncbi:nitroreductase family deazaflavin-dependent oxidoreductase [Amycolatopsis sp. NBC_01488]|uniref:nitroreductase/quinone reductase family protein n=1 Tax=Amycolatopsis sp. NBC_01488 TaxID=2903563 RepID=UPI002E29F2CA|nr:nitroreductase/quinone reductase family protein [Amycolatopsis sp. NBC_01488]